MKTSKELADLLKFEIRNAERHGLKEIRISVSRARTLLADIDTPTPAKLKTPGFFHRLDKIHA